MDEALASLLRGPGAREFLHVDRQRNQYLSEVALHRALLVSQWRELDPRAADLFFVPFYSRVSSRESAPSPSSPKPFTDEP